ncbi:hypothetical protein [Agromyces sp. Soil535]|uniref:hypothetical protein n=1 Tax=Agromyces sp. Soil535 TaxID=1736390 RepID=UPI0006FBFE1F|nr:hypothetical protein [Agromyces sp. Soil535]KRE28271.1 hypothetical protein ASG80_21575 [Agromyces sp. Soil535]
MAKSKVNRVAARVASELARVVAVVSPFDLTTIKTGRGEWMLRSGLIYQSASFPIPPLREHLEDHADTPGEWTCADCSDFHRWRETYERRCIEAGVEPLPVMVAASTLQREGAEFPALDAPQSAFLGFVALMIETPMLNDHGGGRGADVDSL